MPAEREDRLEGILSNLLWPLRDIPFEAFIRGLFDRRVERFDTKRAGCAKLLSMIESAMYNVCLQVQADPIVRSRPDEAGNDMERPVIEQLRHAGLDAGRPTKCDGKSQSMGYPDIEIVTDPVDPAVLCGQEAVYGRIGGCPKGLDRYPGLRADYPVGGAGGVTGLCEDALRFGGSSRRVGAVVRAQPPKGEVQHRSPVATPAPCVARAQAPSASKTVRPCRGLPSPRSGSRSPSLAFEMPQD